MFWNYSYVRRNELINKENWLKKAFFDVIFEKKTWRKKNFEKFFRPKGSLGFSKIFYENIIPVAYIGSEKRGYKEKKSSKCHILAKKNIGATDIARRLELHLRRNGKVGNSPQLTWCWIYTATAHDFGENSQKKVKNFSDFR